jgi:stress-induced morphogen
MSMLQTHETKQIEEAIRPSFPNVLAYRYNSASIRVRVVDERFSSKSRSERHRMLEPVLASLPEDTQSDITVLLLLSPNELGTSPMNVEFEHPTPSRL